MIPFTGTPQSWNEIIASLPHAHFLQTWEMSQAKARTGWQIFPFIWQDETGKSVAAAMVQKRAFSNSRVAPKICALYIPRGPLLDWGDDALRSRVLDDLQAYAKRQGAIYLKIDPDVGLGMGVPKTEDSVEIAGGRAICADLEWRGWQYSKEQIQDCSTILIDLASSEDEMLNRMKQKTRYNVRLAQKKGVVVRFGTLDDIPLLWQMFNETSARDGFALRQDGHYQFVWRSLMSVSPASLNSQPSMESLIAEVDGEPVAAVSISYFAGQALYSYGMSRNIHREKMPNYLLQWEAIRRAKALGCQVYDTWGVPDKFIGGGRDWVGRGGEGVYRFKDGLGGYVYRGIGAWDFAPKPILFRLYIDVLPVVKRIFHLPGPPYTDARYAKPKRKNREGQDGGG